MKPVPYLLLSAMVAAGATPASAQSTYWSGGDRPFVEDYDVGPRRPLTPPLAVGPREDPYDSRGTVVSTTRRVVTPPDAYGIGTTRTVTVTRRVVGERSEPLAVYADPAPRPLPAIRPVVTKDPYDPPRWGGVREVVVPRPLARPPMVLEERRVETTRRYVAPDDLDIED